MISFPEQSHPATIGATRVQIWRGRAATLFGRLLNAFRLPGAIADAVVDDSLTGQHIEVVVGPLFTRVSVNGRDYYFRRLTGKHDGSGSGCC